MNWAFDGKKERVFHVCLKKSYQKYIYLVDTKGIRKESIMNFKKILVLVMTFAMLLTVATPALGVFAHEDNEDTTLVENLKAPLEHAYDFVLENYDDAYAYAYGIVDEKGYITVALDAFDVAFDAIDTAIAEVNAADLSDELKADVLVELEAAKATLAEVEGALDAGKLGTVDGLVASVFALENDLYTHLDNAKVVLDQAAVDATPYVVTAIDLAEAYVAEVVPALLATAEEFAYATVDYILTNLDDIYYSVPGVAADVFETVLEMAIVVDVFVGNLVEDTVEFVLATYAEVYEVATYLYNNPEEVKAFILDLNVMIMNYVAELDATYDLDAKFEVVFGLTIHEAAELLETLGNHIWENREEALDYVLEILDDVKEVGHEEFAKALELYNAVLDVLSRAYGNSEDIVIVTSQIFAYVYDFVVENNTLGEIKEHCDNIVELIAATYGDTKDLYEVAMEIYAYAVEIFADTFHGDYQVTIDSSFVALGNATYGKELAEMLWLGDKYQNFDLEDDYIDALANADFVTVRIDNGQIYDFAVSQVAGYIAGSTLDWNAYLDAEGQEALADVLAAVKAELLSSGAAAEIAANFGGINEEFVANVATYAIESAVYAYAEIIASLETVLSNVYSVAPEATVVITGVQNPLKALGLEQYGIDLSAYDPAIETVVDIFNTQLIAVAYVNENTIYVDSDNAADIYAALDVTCAHHYDNECTDTTCNICGETRVAPGHDWTDWVVVKEATYEEEGLEERTCKKCGEKESRPIPKPIPVGPGGPDDPDPFPWGLVITILVAVAVIAGVLVYRKKKAAKTDEEDKK